MINGSTRAMTEKEQRGLPFLIVSEATDGSVGGQSMASGKFVRQEATWYSDQRKTHRQAVVYVTTRRQRHMRLLLVIDLKWLCGPSITVSKRIWTNNRWLFNIEMWKRHRVVKVWTDSETVSIYYWCLYMTDISKKLDQRIGLRLVRI